MIRRAVVTAASRSCTPRAVAASVRFATAGPHLPGPAPQPFNESQSLPHVAAGHKADLHTNTDLAQLAVEFTEFTVGHDLTRRQVCYVEDLIEALRKSQDVFGKVADCNNMFYHADFKDNAHRDALLDLLFKIHNTVLPPLDEQHQGVLHDLHALIRQGGHVAVKELLALDAAIRRNASAAVQQKAIADCNEAAYRMDFKDSTHRGALLDFLFKIHNAVQPARDERRQELLAQLNLHIRHGVGTKELLALDDAVRRNDEKSERIAFTNCIAVVIDNDILFNLICRFRDALQPPQKKFATLIPELDQLIRDATDDKVAESLRAVDDTLRLDQSAASTEKQIAAIRTAFKATAEANCGAESSELLIDLRKKVCVSENRTPFIAGLYSLLGRPQSDAVARHLCDLDAALNEPDEVLLETVKSCTDMFFSVDGEAPDREEMLQLVLRIDAVVRPFPIWRTTVANHLAVLILHTEDSDLASKLWRLRDALRHTHLTRESRMLIDQCERAGAPADLMKQVLRSFPPMFLKDAAAANATLGTHFCPDYDGGHFDHINGPRQRSVVFLSARYRITVEHRAVTTNFQSSMIAWENKWDKLVVITGPSGCGKTVMGLFGLARTDQVLVYVGTPPELGDDPEYIAGDVRASNEVRELGKKARALPSGAEKRRLLRDALGQHLLEKLTAIFGERPGFFPADEVIFFFDELGGDDQNSSDVRVGVCELAKALHASTKADTPFAFGNQLNTKLRLKVCGFAMGGTGLDAELAMGSLGKPDAYRTVTPNCDGLQWEQLTWGMDRLSVADCTPDERATLDAALCLPRLAALILKRASARTADGRITMKLLHSFVECAVNDFMRLNALSSLVAGRQRGTCVRELEFRAAKSRQQVAQHCFELLFSPPTCPVQELSPYTRDFISSLGLVTVLPETEVGGPARLHIGPGQRLVLRHLLALENPTPSGEGFERRMADFLCLAVPASQGRTLSEFLGALNRFFSYELQHPNTRAKNAPPPPAVAAPEGMESHVLAADCAVVWRLRWKVEAGDVSAEVSKMTKGFKVERNQCTVLVNGDGAAASWDLQLVLPVVDAATARKVKREKWTRSTELRHVTFDLKAYVDAALSGPELELDRARMAGVPRTALPRKARDGGLVAVVGRPLRQATEGAAGVPVWHVNMADPGSLGVVPFRVLGTDDADGKAFAEERFGTSRGMMTPS